jgi:hypothetical protein
MDGSDCKYLIFVNDMAWGRRRLIKTHTNFSELLNDRKGGLSSKIFFDVKFSEIKKTQHVDSLTFFPPLSYLSRYASAKCINN